MDSHYFCVTHVEQQIKERSCNEKGDFEVKKMEQINWKIGSD